MFPPRRIVCLTEETVETLYLLGEQDRIVGISSGSSINCKAAGRAKSAQVTGGPMVRIRLPPAQSQQRTLI